MKKFSDFGVKPNSNAFIGEKIRIERLLNCEIIVYDFRIEPSKFDGDRLTMQIEYNGEKRVIFTASIVLRDMIQQVPRNEFPFTTKIVKVNEYFEFT